MNPDDIRALLTGGDIAPPFEIHTKGGKSYPVTDARNVWSPEAYPDLLIVAMPRRGIAMVRPGEIASIACEEHEAVQARG